ncbi:hypothetical protein [Zhaonella formicivorans]|nr:hypothetical protein [Zhaonella formicivorans]
MSKILAVILLVLLGGVTLYVLYQGIIYPLFLQSLLKKKQLQ